MKRTLFLFCLLWSLSLCLSACSDDDGLVYPPDVADAIPDGEFRVLCLQLADTDLNGVISKEEALARIKELQPPLQEDGTPTARALARVFSLCDRKGMVHACWMFRHADGSPLPCEGVMVRLTSSLGRGYFASVHDLREIRAYEATLQNERRLLSDVVEAAPSAMLICTGEGKARMLNPSAARLTGLAAGENCSGIWADYQGYLDPVSYTHLTLPTICSV